MTKQEPHTEPSQTMGGTLLMNRQYKKIAMATEQSHLRTDISPSHGTRGWG